MLDIAEAVNMNYAGFVAEAQDGKIANASSLMRNKHLRAALKVKNSLVKPDSWGHSTR